jgi:hypothetical protein
MPEPDKYFSLLDDRPQQCRRITRRGHFQPETVQCRRVSCMHTLVLGEEWLPIGVSRQESLGECSRPGTQHELLDSAHCNECIWLPNALVQLQAHYHHCGEAASEKCLSAATFVRWPAPITRTHRRKVAPVRQQATATDLRHL